MSGVRDWLSNFKGHLGVPSTSTSKRHSRSSSPNPSAYSRTTSQSRAKEDVGMEDATPPPKPFLLQPDSTFSSASTSPPPFPTAQPGHNRHLSLEVPTINTPMFNSTPSPKHSPRSRLPSITPMPDNEVRAQASLSTQCAMSFAAVVQELAPIPCIGPLIGCLTIVFQAVEKTRINKEQWKLLQGRCVMVTRIAGAQVTNYGGEYYPSLPSSAELLQNTITKIGQRAAYWNEMQEFLALLEFQNISEEIRGHFTQLDVCLCMFSYAADVAQMQWIDEFSVVQRAELRELSEMRELMVSLNGNVDTIGQTTEQGKTPHGQMDEKLKKILEDKYEILQHQGTTPIAENADAQKIIRSILTITGAQFPPQILVGRQCILEANVPINMGMTCDIYAASFLGGEKVAKKVFRIRTSEKEKVQKYAEKFLRDAKLWATFKSDYTLPFYGVGMEAFEGDQYFQLYMVSPLMKNFDAVTYLKEYKNNSGIKQNIMRIIIDAARGLHYLHSRDPPVVHSGMRGDNILITDSGGAMLGGFGLTKVLGNSTGNEVVPPAVMTGKTESQRWMAPEMHENDLPVLQPPSDVWGWAMATLEIVSCNPPYFKHKQPHTIMLQISTGKKPTRKDHVEFDKYAHRPDELWALLEKCWAMSPGDRPTILEVINDLERMRTMPSGRPMSMITPSPKIEVRAQASLGTQSTVSLAADLQERDSLTITSMMSISEVVACLGDRGCIDMTAQLDETASTRYPISNGGFGDIYRGRLLSGREVAIKTMRLYVGSGDENKKELKHTARELYAWSKCRHPNVQDLLGLVQFRGQIGMISGWEENGNLLDYLRRHPSSDRCRMSAQISNGLAYLHSSGIVHGDLKGVNVLITQSGAPLLADFGNATLQDYTLKFSKTATKTAISVRWAAPELFEGKTSYSAEADVYALGMTILETITGNVPFFEKNEHSVIFALVKREHPERPHTHISAGSERGEALWILLKQCWASNPSERPSAEDVKEQMKTIKSDALVSRK